MLLFFLFGLAMFGFGWNDGGVNECRWWNRLLKREHERQAAYDTKLVTLAQEADDEIARLRELLQYYSNLAAAERHRAQRFHRRAQQWESVLWRLQRKHERVRQQRNRMTDVVCEAWDALPEDIRDEITKPMRLDGSEGGAAPDLVRGVKMLVECMEDERMHAVVLGTEYDQ